MNDRYLYRAKRTDNGEWITGSLIQADYIGTARSWISSEQDDKARLREISSNQAVWRAFEVRTDTICQCTGLKDKNGKLIWENDIVHNGNYFVVKWNLSCARFDFALNNSHNIPVGRWEPMIIDWKNSDFKDYRNNIDFEVIGNIFDNPELLEK